MPVLVPCLNQLCFYPPDRHSLAQIVVRRSSEMLGMFEVVPIIETGV